jgi:hypothetical protein
LGNGKFGHLFKVGDYKQLSKLLNNFVKNPRLFYLKEKNVPYEERRQSSKLKALNYVDKKIITYEILIDGVISINALLFL